LLKLLKKWKDEGKPKEVFEEGSAFGMVLNEIKTAVPNLNVSGSEWGQKFRRNAYHEYGIALGDKFDDSKKHDLIISYKVAEHMIDADKELRKYAENLTEEGLLYISVPAWFDKMTNFGVSGWSIEYYYHPDHINVWTKKLFETVLKKAGLEIVKQNLFQKSFWLGGAHPFFRQCLIGCF